MKALILNSGIGKRMGNMTIDKPKCLLEISSGETVLSRQLKQLEQFDITNVIITTGKYDRLLKDYCRNLNLNLKIDFILNPLYDKTNYIYSIYCAKDILNDNLIFMHGDLVFSDRVFNKLLNAIGSQMIVCSSVQLPQKDFKAVLKNNIIKKIGIEFFENAITAQPLYKLSYKDWNVWLAKIVDYCEAGIVNCYAENAFNDVSDKCIINPLDIGDELCAEIDTLEDLIKIQEVLLK